MANFVVVAPGAYIFAEYTASWEAKDWPETKAEIEILVARRPVVRMVFEEAETDEFLPDFRPVYLQPNGWLATQDDIPEDWGEEGVNLGMFPAEVDSATLKELAQNKCWARCVRNKANEVKAAGRA